MAQTNWATLGCSVIGASHVKRGMENQDSIYFGGPPVFVAVADGHGGKKYVRSHIGSRLAVTAISNTLAQCLPLHSQMKDIDTNIRHIKSRFLLHWQNSVDENLSERPLSQEEQEVFKQTENLRQAFGTTFLCAVAYDDLILLLQHGDGDIIGLYEDQAIDLMDEDIRNFAGNTLSLGSLTDAGEIGHKVLTKKEIPSLITLSTDGIKNSYNDTVPQEIEQFYKIPRAIKEALDQGLEITADLQDMLTKITANGSGDDVTLGVLYSRL
ncbi:MAG: protein phosphatase 2C domain-containing protein [Defluviitaleaceae bacterium]|nr:protein phosphatase 2C domain-containing protein [Defluviitaleaceae bacterium]